MRRKEGNKQTHLPATTVTAATTKEGEKEKAMKITHTKQQFNLTPASMSFVREAGRQTEEGEDMKDTKFLGETK